MIGRRRRTLGVVVAVLALAAFAASQLRSVSSADLLVGGHTQQAKAGRALDRSFGQDPIVVEVHGDLRQLLSSDIGGLLELEGKLAQVPGVQAVYGPASFLNESVVQAEIEIKQQLGSATSTAKTVNADTRRKALAAGLSEDQAEKAADAAVKQAVGSASNQLAQILNQLGSIGLPSLTNTSYVNGVVYGAGVQPKARFRWLFPDNQHTLILIRPKPGVSGAAMLRLGDRIQALAQGSRKTSKTVKNAISDGTLRVAGLPLLAAGLEKTTRDEILHLAPFTLGVMLLLLLAVLWRRRGRFIALVSALGAVVLTLGLSWPFGLGLSVATVAALPVVLGLGLDFAIQTQARYWLERQRGLLPEAAALSARRAVAPTLSLAAGVMALGFVVLMAGKVPVIDRLGAVLALGTLSGAGLAIGVVPALLVAVDGGRTTKPLGLRVPEWIGRAGLNPLGAVVLVALAVGGLCVSGAVRLQSDLTTLAPKALPQLKGVQALQRDIGTAGQISIAIRGQDVTRPDVITWMAAFAARAQKAEPRLRPGPNLADIITERGATPDVTQASVNGVIGSLPPYLLNGVLSKDHRTAELTYAIPFVSVGEQQRIVDRIRGALGTPPPGVTVTPTGLVAESGQSAHDLEGSRPWLLLLAAAAISFALWLRWRDLRRVALVLSPALLAAGLSTLVMAIADVTLSPLGAALEPLVLAIGLEFGMLLDMGYRQARRRGLDPSAARRATTRDIGGAVGLSAATVAAGFAVLSFSRLPLLSQLGWLVALELALTLAVAVIVVPLVAEWLDLPPGAPRPPRRARARPRRTKVPSGRRSAFAVVGEGER